MTDRKLAFTLIELLIVIAIIAILALIALPNILEAQIRAKVTRMKADMRSVSAAMEAYYVDANCYPPKPAVACSCGGWQCALSTPVPYLTSPLPDVFYAGAGPENRFFQYSHCPMMRSYIFVSIGPDTVDSFDETMWMCGKWSSYPPLYDPTNGATSHGDVFRVSKQGGALPMHLRPMD